MTNAENDEEEVVYADLPPVTTSQPCRATVAETIEEAQLRHGHMVEEVEEDSDDDELVEPHADEEDDLPSSMFNLTPDDLQDFLTTSDSPDVRGIATYSNNQCWRICL